ncbi:MAG: GNAT family N-acetyltransferase [Propionibacteriaceae bacterium]|nr:GNAT family N-acetyltransferase [Propionibacteriaceae bacterium]
MTIHNLGTQTLTTARLRLRRLCIDDVDAMYSNWASDPEVTEFLVWPAYTDKGSLREYLTGAVADYDCDATYRWGIELSVDGTLIGSIAAVGGDDGIEMKSIGYCIGRRWWGRGYTSEALGAVIAYLIEQVGVNRVEAVHDADNVASGRVMAKCGMRYEGILRARQRSNRGIRDALMWSILADDYNATRAAATSA